MRYRILLLTALLWLCAWGRLGAQNRIDELMDSYTSVGSSVFTSAVERDPATRKVQKIVKSLTLRGDIVNKFVRAFEEEKYSGKYYRSEDTSGKVLVTLTTESREEKRLYVLTYKGRGYYSGDIYVTIHKK